MKAKAHYEILIDYKKLYSQLDYQDKDIHMLITTLLELGLYYEKNSRGNKDPKFAKSLLDYYQYALALASENNEQRVLAKVQARIGNFYHHLGDYKNAYIFHETAVANIIPYAKEKSILNSNFSFWRKDLNGTQNFQSKDEELFFLLRYCLSEGTQKRLQSQNIASGGNKRLKSDLEQQNYDENANDSNQLTVWQYGI